MVGRVDALEGNLDALVSELVVLNSSVKALTEAMVSKLRQKQDNTQYQSKADGHKTFASSTPDARAWKTSPSGSHSPSTKHTGSHKGNESLASGPEVAERTRSSTLVPSEPHSGEIRREQSHTSLDMNVHAPPPVGPRLTSVDEDATTVDETADGSISPGSECALGPPPMKAIAGGPKSRKRTPSNARGKTIANDTALDAKNDCVEEPEMTFPITTTQKASKHGTYLALWK